MSESEERPVPATETEAAALAALGVMIKDAVGLANGVSVVINQHRSGAFDATEAIGQIEMKTIGFLLELADRLDMSTEPLWED